MPELASREPSSVQPELGVDALETSPGLSRFLS